MKESKTILESKLEIKSHKESFKKNTEETITTKQKITSAIDICQLTADLIRNPSKNYRSNKNYETEDNLGNRQLTINGSLPNQKKHIDLPRMQQFTLADLHTSNNNMLSA